MTWISVKDRLPEMRTVVILYYPPKPASRFLEAQDGYMRTGCYSAGRWCDFWQEEEEIDSPTHWQPLPEPPGPSLAELRGKVWVADGPAYRVKPDEAGFLECDTCRAKPGSPYLCAGCLNNRGKIWARFADRTAQKPIHQYAEC